MKMFLKFMIVGLIYNMVAFADNPPQPSEGDTASDAEKKAPKSDCPCSQRNGAIG